MPNGPFAIDKIAPGVSTTTRTLNPTHLFHTNRAQINGGANDLFAAYSSVRGFTMGYYSRDAMESSHLWRLARENTLLDRFFMGAFGGSFLNHQYLVCACAPKWENAPEGERSKLDASGRPVLRDEAENFFEDNRVTRREDGNLAVNTTQSVFLNAGGRVLLPPQTAPTIGDRLSDRQVEWAWYSGGFELAARTDRTQQETNYLNGALRFQWHHQPFAYYARFNPAEAQGREQRTRHLRDAGRLLDDIKSGRLPAVSFYKPVGALNQHPGYTVIEKGDEEVASIALKQIIVGFFVGQVPATDADVALIRRKAADFLKHYRDSGAGAIGLGPQERLKRSLELMYAVPLQDENLGMYLEDAAFDHWSRSLEWSATPDPKRLADFSVTVIGAGMGGLNAAIQLDRAGIRYNIVEKNEGVGGTWHENRYPGARLDTLSRIYFHIFGIDFQCKSPFSPAQDNERYFSWAAERFALNDDIVFGTEVKSIVWNEADRKSTRLNSSH